jgi:hypothetical protein
MSITFLARRKYDKEPISITRTGKVYPVGDVTIELFTVQVLAEAVERTDQSIKAWETEDKFPVPMFRVKGKTFQGSPIRFYSGGQILLCNLIYRSMGASKGASFNRKAFAEQVRLYFYRPNLSVDPTSGVITFEDQ